jgi:hypothetical protein
LEPEPAFAAALDDAGADPLVAPAWQAARESTSAAAANERVIAPIRPASALDSS